MSKKGGVIENPILTISPSLFPDIMSREEFAHNMQMLSRIEDTERFRVVADRLIIEFLKQIGYNLGAEIFEKRNKLYE